MSQGLFNKAEAQVGASAPKAEPEGFSRPFLALEAAKAGQVMRREVPPAEFAVFVALVSHDRGDRVVWPGVPLIARLTGVTARRVRGALRGLAGRGWIEAVGVTPGGVVRYRLLSESGMTPASPDASVTLTSASKTKDASVTQKGTGKKGTVSIAQSDPEGFAEFWIEWPKKKSKGQARRAWKSALKKASSSEIMAGLVKQLPALRAIDPQFVPYPATWLNGERWEDEASASASKPLVFKT